MALVVDHLLHPLYSNGVSLLLKDYSGSMVVAKN
jgi:hypothetical protein